MWAPMLSGLLSGLLSGQHRSLGHRMEGRDAQPGPLGAIAAALGPPLSKPSAWSKSTNGRRLGHPEPCNRPAWHSWLGGNSCCETNYLPILGCMPEPFGQPVTLSTAPDGWGSSGGPLRYKACRLGSGHRPDEMRHAL